MDASDALLQLDSQGVCNHCRNTEIVAKGRPQTEHEAESRLDSLARRIRDDRKGNDYDSILGISGGTDSAYTLHLAKELGLRPLVVHLDNGWNSEAAVFNIKRLVDGCGYDLYTHVVNWPEFRDIQRSLLLASVLDVELVTDHSFFALLFRIAREKKIKYSLLGNNCATESFMPRGWNWNKGDLRNLKAIHQKFGTKPIKTLPTLNFWVRLVYEKLGMLCKPVYLLENSLYRQGRALEILGEKYGYRYCGGKHYESIFTKFYQAYILPKKFGIDKRRVHFSSLITNGELSRQHALERLALPAYDPAELRVDYPFVIKKLGFSAAEFEALMQQAPVSHDVYPSDKKMVDLSTWLKLRILGPG